MKQITFNPSNEPYYSEDFIKGFECGTQRQLEADLADRPQGEWIEHKNAEEICGTLISNYECPLCHEWQTLISNFCPSCGARMKGADDEQAMEKGNSNTD